MRIRRLDLTRYGKFTDATIDFGPISDGPDLHIVYGLNEAGKSTTLNAFLDLLYGIEDRSRYAFLHEYGAMRIGGLLDIDGTEHQFTRIKQRANSLLNAAGQPVGEMALSAHLAGLSREAFASMFSLDDDTLEAGGKTILDSRGDLGQLLFAASAGLAQASNVLNQIQTEADEIHRKHAQQTELALLKKQLMELKSQRDEVDTLASSYEALETERADANRTYDTKLTERSGLTTRLNTIERQLRVIPMLADLARRQARLSSLPTMPTPTVAFVGNVSDLIRDDATLEASIAAKVDEITRLEEKISNISIDSSVLGISERIDSLSERKARHVSAGLDLPTRRMELQVLDDAVAASLTALGKGTIDDPSSLLLPSATVGILRSKLQERSGIDTATRVAREEATSAAFALQIAKDRVGDERAVPAPARARLAAALASARESGHERRLREAQEHLDVCTTRWQIVTGRLQSQGSDVIERMSMFVPSLSQLSTWKTALGEGRARLSIIADRVAELEHSREAAAASLAGCRESVNVPDDEEAANSRRSRDQAWKLHREALVDDTAEAFAAALASDDDIGVKRLAGARELQELRGAAKNLSDVDAALTRVRNQQRQAEDSIGALASAIRASAGKISAGWGDSVPPEQALELLEGFHMNRSAAIEAQDQLELAKARLGGVGREGTTLKAELVLAGQRVGISIDEAQSLEGAASVAELFLDRQGSLDTKVAEAWRNVAAREEDLAARKLALAAAEAREAAWNEGMAHALAGSWLANGVDFASIGSILDQLSILGKDLQDREALRRRVTKMEADREAFFEEVSAAAAIVGEMMNPQAPEQVAALLTARLENARRSSEAREALKEELRRLESVRDELQIEADAHERRKIDVLQAFQVTTLAEVSAQDELLKERDRLHIAIGEIEETIVREMGTTSAVDAQLLLENADPEEMNNEAEQLRQRLEDLQLDLQQQVVRQARADDRLQAVGSDSTIARLDARRRTVLLEIEEKAIQFLRLKLGAMAAENAIREYRERHRSGLMQTASDTFAAMTCGMYSGLSSQPSKAGEILIATQSDGRSKVADALSKGTRFQLYLSLRMAAYYEFSRNQRPVPFLADDILETFDHRRSEQVLRLFSRMAEVGQVIYLTHHEHLCELARRVVPNVKVHEIA